MENTDALGNLVGGFLNLLIGTSALAPVNFDKLIKGGKIKMETKSRYEVIAELEDKKRSLIQERDSFPDKIIKLKKEIKFDERELEDKKEELMEFEKTVEERKETIKELITSIDDSLKRLSNISK